MIADAEVLELHRRIVSIPSISGNEAEVVAFLDGWLTERGVAVERVGDSLLSLVGDGPLCLLDTHVDTVPPASGWSRDPHDVAVDDGKVIGLGANDAKASVAAMCSAFVAVAKAELPIAIGLALVAGEETDGHGTEEVLAELERRGRKPVAAVVGEPTGLDVAVAQKGLLILELQTTGTSCHAAHGERLGARNAIRAIARDLVSIERVDLGDEHPLLGGTTLEPTMIHGGTARNVIPTDSSVILDLRTTPKASHEELVDRISKAVRGKVNAVSTRLVPRETEDDDPVVRAAVAARPDAKLFGSATMSDMVFMDRIAAIKVGPGQTDRSHTADEFVLETEILEGARFYEALLRAYAERAWEPSETTSGEVDA